MDTSMANVFDDAKRAAFDTVGMVMGYDATWSPSAGGPQQTARILYKDPTEDKELAMIDFSPNEYVMEYRVDFFTGLKLSIGSSNQEVITIAGKGDFYVRKVDAIFDGDRFRAIIKPKTS
jgi:hypothetical protein